MISVTQVRRFFSVFLLTAILFIGSAIGSFNSQAFAAPSASNEVSNVRGESKDINGSYHRLQAATQDSWDKYKDEQQAFSSNKSARLAQPKQAIKNINQNTKNAFQRTADSIKDGLSLQ